MGPRDPVARTSPSPMIATITRSVLRRTATYWAMYAIVIVSHKAKYIPV